MLNIIVDIRSARANKHIMSNEFPIAFITWTSYGTWLPGDDRGWVKLRDSQIQTGNIGIYQANRKAMNESAFVLSHPQGDICDQVIRDHCRRREWDLLALNVRTNHIHLVIDASVSGWEAMRQLKSWCTRKLKETDEHRVRWWTRSGWVRYLEEEESLRNAIRYTNERQ